MVDKLMRLIFNIKEIKFRNDDDFIDRLTRRHTTSVLLLFSLVITTKQYVGDPIFCWAPAHFTGILLFSVKFYHVYMCIVPFIWSCNKLSHLHFEVLKTVVLLVNLWSCICLIYTWGVCREQHFGRYRELDQHIWKQWVLVPFHVLDQCKHLCTIY